MHFQEMEEESLAASAANGYKVNLKRFTPSMKVKDERSRQELSPLLRMYVYGIHGYFTEVMFTAAWEFVVNTNWKFPGCTSVWSLFMYAISVYVIERIYVQFGQTVPLLIRGLIYLVWTYTFEFCTGWMLRYFNACPWDYTPFDYDIMGLITLEYAPLWYLATMTTEQLLIKNILRLQWNTMDLNIAVNNQRKTK